MKRNASKTDLNHELKGTFKRGYLIAGEGDPRPTPAGPASPARPKRTVMDAGPASRERDPQGRFKADPGSLIGHLRAIDGAK